VPAISVKNKVSVWFNVVQFGTEYIYAMLRPPPAGKPENSGRRR
jgi:hypothetical protein